MAVTRSSQSIKRSAKRAHSPDSSPLEATKKIKVTEESAALDTEPGLNLLELPVEIRLLIYSHIVDFTGVVVIYARHELAKEVNKDSIALLHICQLIREEVKLLFYRNQTFRFCSVPAIDNFLQSIGREFAGSIRRIEITPWLGIRKDFLSALPRIFEWLDGVERLKVLHADKRFVSIHHHSRVQIPILGLAWTSYSIQELQTAEVCGNTLMILRASTRLAAGRVYYFHDRQQPELQFVPSDVVYTNASDDSTFDRFEGGVVELEIPHDLEMDTDIGTEGSSGAKEAEDLTDV